MEPVHHQVLDAARHITGRTQRWRFALADVVAALPHLNAATVRTHVASRCCVNAPANHQSRQRYFRAVERGVYQIEPEHRTRPAPRPRGWQDELLEQIDSGVDRTLILESLRRTPTERLRAMADTAESLDDLRQSATRRRG